MLFQRSAVAVMKKAARPGIKKSRLESISLKNEADPTQQNLIEASTRPLHSNKGFDSDQSNFIFLRS